MYSFSVRCIDFSAFCYKSNDEHILTNYSNNTENLCVFTLADLPVCSTLLSFRSQFQSHLPLPMSPSSEMPSLTAAEYYIVYLFVVCPL